MTAETLTALVEEQLTTDYGQLVLDWLPTALNHDHDDELTLSTAIQVWVKILPTYDLRQCWPACYVIGELLAAVGHHPHIVTAVATVMDSESGEGVEFGSRTLGVVDEPRIWDGRPQWDGHTVLHIPEMSAIFDPTIGFQGGYTVVDKDRCPLLLRAPELQADLKPGLRLCAVKTPPIKVYYEIVGDGRDIPAFRRTKDRLDLLLQQPALDSFDSIVEVGRREWQRVSGQLGTAD